MSAQAMARAPEFQRTIELINKYTISTLQFMNRFSSHCESKLLHVNRQLQRLEAQVVLLEYKLESIDNGPGGAAEMEAQQAKGLGAGAGPKGEAAKALPGAPPPMQLTGPPGLSGASAPPMMPGFGGGPSAPPPPPGHKMPPLPPGVSPVAPGGAPMMPPPMMAMPGQPPPGFVPPPPPPQMGNTVTIRQHAKLQGYFRMLEAGVPIAAVKAKMQVDGADPSWLDTPHAPAPPQVANMKSSQNYYDSD